MISVGSRNGRKGVEFSFGGEEMAEAELEEGEACFQNEEDDSAIDPDIALSYIDEKLQDVLGHFQKDFEGGVSAENLGAKFGGYGSFLPTYQRSPTGSRPKTSPEVYNCPTRSPNNMHLEGDRHNSISLASASLPGRPGVSSSNFMPVLKPPSGNQRLNQDVSAPSIHGEELATNEVQRCTSFPDQKTLKFRIRVGTDDLSTRRNADIYSGLGLDVSPSSSFDDSPGDSEGLYHGPLENPHESPTSILRIMTSIPFSRSQLLSPLSDQTVHLIKKEWASGRSKSKNVTKACQGNSRMVKNDSRISNGKFNGEKKPKSQEISALLIERSNNNSKEISDDTLAPKKEFDVDTCAGEEPGSTTLKLPVLSNSYVDAAESVKDPVKSVTNSKAAARGRVTNTSSYEVAEEEPLQPVALPENGTAERFNRKFDASDTVCESRKQNWIDQHAICHTKEVNHKQGRAELSIKPESYISEERNPVNRYVTDTSKQKVARKVTSHNEDILKSAPGEQQFSSGAKKKSKGSQSLVVPDVECPEDAPIITSSMGSKSKKTYSNSISSKSDPEGLKKADLEATDRCKEFFGDLGLEEEADEIASQKMPSLGRSKISEFVEKKGTSESNGTLKERPTGKTTEEKSTSKDHPRLPSYVPHLVGKAPNSDAAPTMAAPLVKEDWVCCDKCQAWRLLPLGTNPESLPEKWLCSMLKWLPGMNHCSISEEETTNALRALYHTQASTAQSQHNQHPHPGGILSGMSSGDARRSSEDSQNSGLQPTASGGKKKFGSKDLTNATKMDCSVQVSDLKNNFQDSSKCRKSSEVDLSPSRDEFTYQHEGEGMRAKMKSKRENDLDATRASKKMKTEDVFLKDENCTSDQAGASSKAARSSNRSFPNTASWKDCHSHSSHSRDLKGDLKKNIVSSEKPEAQISVDSDDSSLHMAKGTNACTKKRKGSDHQKPSVSDLPQPSEGHHSQGSRVFLEESHEYDQRKDKKTRVSKSEGKDSNRSQGTMIAGRKVAQGTKDREMGQDLGSIPSRRSLDAPESLRRDLGSVQHAVATTSSSSKVSGSHRSKASRGEMKGSPVESVSSSPLRIPVTDKFSQARKDVGSKDDLFATASPRRSINGADTGGSDRSGKTKDDSHNLMQNGSHESSVIDFQGADLGHVPNGRGKVDCTSLPAAQGVPNCSGNPQYQDNQTARLTEISEQSFDERKRIENQYTSNGSQSKKSGKGSSSRSKEKTRGSRAGLDNCKIKDAEMFDGSMYEEKARTGKNKFLEKTGNSSERLEKSYPCKKDSAGKGNREISKEESHHIHQNGPGARPEVPAGQSTMQNVQRQFDVERTSRKLHSGKTGIEDSERVKSHSLQPSVRGQSEAMTRSHPTIELKKDNGENGSEHDDASKVSKQSKKVEKQNGIQPVNMRNLTPPTLKGRELDTRSPVRKESSNQIVTNAVKEAKDLKHMADRLKHSGSTESTGLYFQAALKFLHGASLLESSGSENAKHNEMIQSRQIYSSTAKLCEFCAHEYEKSKDMAAAALAYKCVEVAYMRVIYTSHTNASRDRNELQAALQIIPTGESPSSSASDIDNLNNPATADKPLIPKGVASPQVTGNHVLTARTRTSCMQLIKFAQEVSYAMEASRKSRARFGEAESREGISSVKSALDFNFQDIDGLLHLVRVAMEAINR